MALIDKLTAIADGFRASRGTTQEYTLDEMAVLAAEEVGGGNFQAKTITPSEETQVVTPDEGYDALSSVTVLGVVGGVLAQNEKKYQFGKASCTGDCEPISGESTAYGVTY